MQGQKNTIFNLGSVPSNSETSQQASTSNILSPLERRLISPADPTCGDATGSDIQNFTDCQSGSALHLQTHVNDNGIKTEHVSDGAFTQEGSRSEQRQFEPSNRSLGTVDIGSSSTKSAHPSQSQNSSASYASRYMSLNPGSFTGNTIDGQVMGSSVFPTSSAAGFYDIVGTSAGSSGSMVENDGNPGTSLGNLGSSCKRKASEGTSGQSDCGRSSSCFPISENSMMHAPGLYHASSSSALSTLTWHEQLNSRNGVETRGDAFPSWNASGNADGSPRNFGMRMNSGHQQESVPFNIASTSSSRLSSPSFLHQHPRPVPHSESRNLQPQSHPRNVSSRSRTVHPFVWNGNRTSRVGSSSGERRSALPEIANFRIFPENSEAELSLTRDGTDQNSLTGNINPAGGALPGTLVDPCSSVLPTPSETSQNPLVQNQQSSSDIDPWSLFPPLESELGGQHGGILSVPSVPSASSSERAVSSRVNNRQRLRQSHRRSAFLLEGQGDDIFGMPRSLHSLAADVEGRQRLISEIRQVLNAVRRGESMRAEDDMVFDTFIFHGMAELPDRHRDMRLDVDNMSYEELLELEERIGDVSTGLSEETIIKCMKQRKHISATHTVTSVDMEPCCVCQEVYGNGDDIGTLDCGHDFHTNCIKQWLVQKNLCPICKTTALAS